MPHESCAHRSVRRRSPTLKRHEPCKGTNTIGELVELQLDMTVLQAARAPNEFIRLELQQFIRHKARNCSTHSGPTICLFASFGTVIIGKE